MRKSQNCPPEIADTEEHNIVGEKHNITMAELGGLLILQGSWTVDP